MSETAYQTTTLVTLVPVTCCSCGVAFGMPAYLNKKRLDDRKTFWCPNGHSQHYTGKTEEERLRAQLKFAQDRAESERRAKDAARRSLAATKGVLTRTKNRVAAGVCPCCSKEFKVLAKHMASAHPEYVHADEPRTPGGAV